MTDPLQQTAALARLLEDRLIEWDKARKPQELKLLECYQDVMRIPREEDTKGTGAARAKKAAGLFIGSTRNKVRAARAKINDALFGAGRLPFDTKPTNEKMAVYADAVEDILTEQFERMKLKRLLKGGVNTLAKFGTGFVFGPFVRKEKLQEVEADNSAGFTQLKETEYEFDFPYFELGNTLDVYPDPEAREIGKGLGCFWVTMESPHTVSAWKSDKRYSNIEEATKAPGDSSDTGSDQAKQLRGNVDYWFKNERVKVARFFGKVPANMLNKDVLDDADLEEDKNEGDMIDVVVIMAGGVVVKVDESPYGKDPVMRCGYEEEEDEMWAVGVAENNQPHQKVTNAAFRLFMEGKGMALLGTSSVDRSKFLPTEDFRKFPGKVYQMKPGLSPDERNSAIIQHLEPDITGGWMDVIRMSEQFSDDDTGITKYTQGDDASNLNKTASGISMIMSASSLPIKEVIQNIDEMWIEEIVERTIEWDLKFLEVETVQKIHGEEIAGIWAQIKKFGKHSFMDWQATGTSSFMQKEILANKIRAFADFALSNPATAQKIDVTELLTQTWDVMEIGRESPILKEEKETDISPQVKQQMQQMQQQIQQLSDALGKAGDHVDELESEAKSKANEIEVKRIEANTKAYQAITQRLSMLAPLLSVDEVQQLAAETRREAMEQPDPGQPPSESMGIPEQMPDEGQQESQELYPQEQTEPPGFNEQQEQPADAGFFTPEQ